MPHSDRLLLGPGPSNPYPEVDGGADRGRCSGTSIPSSSPCSTRRWSGCARVFRTTNALTLPISGTGSAGMEACFVNLLEPGDTVIVGVNGVFGERMCEVARRCGAEVVRVDEPWGRALDPQRLLDAQRAAPGRAPRSPSCTPRRRPASRTTSRRSPRCGHRHAARSSTPSPRSAASPSRSTAGASTPCYSGTQKCLGVPPGLAPVTFSRARRRAHSQTASHPPQSWYLDLGLIADYVGGSPRRYHHTAPISMLYALHAGLGVLLDEGLDAAWARHRARRRAACRTALPELGFRLVGREGPPASRAHLGLAARRRRRRRRCARRCSTDLRHRGRRRAGRVRGQGLAHRPHGPLGPRALGHHAPRRAARAAHTDAMSAVADRYRRHADAFERMVGGRARPSSGPISRRARRGMPRGVVEHVVVMHGVMLRPVDQRAESGPVRTRRSGAARSRWPRADVEAVLDDPELAGLECDTPNGRMTVARQIDEVVSDDLVLHGWDLARATGQDDTMDPEDVERLWAITTAIPAALMEKYRTPGRVRPRGGGLRPGGDGRRGSPAPGPVARCHRARPRLGRTGASPPPARPRSPMTAVSSRRAGA